MRLIAFFVSLYCCVTFCYAEQKKVVDSQYAIETVQQALLIENELDVRELAEGLSDAKIFLVTSSDKSYVVRFIFQPASIIAREIACLNIASSEGYGPHVYASDVEKGFVIMEYVPFSLREGKDKILQYVAEAVSKMHHGPHFPQAKTIFEDVGDDLHTLQKSRSFEEIAISMEEMVKQLYHVLSPMFIRAPCHNDLNPLNLRFSGSRVKVIDYESASQDDPFFDIATVVILLHLNPNEENSFLQAYFQRPITAEESKKLDLMKQLVYIVYAIRLFNSLPNDEHFKLDLEHSDLSILQKIREGKEHLLSQEARLELALGLFVQAKKAATFLD